MWYRTRFQVPIRFSRNSFRSYELSERLTVTVNSHGKRFSDRFSALLDWSVRQIKWSAGGQPSAPRSCNYVRQMKFPTEWSRGARYWASAANYDGIVPARAHVRLETQQSGVVWHRCHTQRDATLHPPSGAPANLLRRRWTQYSCTVPPALRSVLRLRSFSTALLYRCFDSLYATVRMYSHMCLTLMVYSSLTLIWIHFKLWYFLPWLMNNNEKWLIC